MYLLSIIFISKKGVFGEDESVWQERIVLLQCSGSIRDNCKLSEDKYYQRSKTTNNRYALNIHNHRWSS